jgi:chromosome segregation ATPase
MNMAREVVTEPSRTIHKDQESCIQLSLEHEYEQLQARQAELEAAAVKSVDLENVVSQLRLRVSELEAQESRVSDLRYECRTLRSRIAELIGSTLDLRTLEHEHAELTRELEFQERQQQQQQQDGGAIPSPLPEITGNYV